MMRVFDDGLTPVDFDNTALLENLQADAGSGRSQRLRDALVIAVLAAILAAALALKYWVYLP